MFNRKSAAIFVNLILWGSLFSSPASAEISRVWPAQTRSPQHAAGQKFVLPPFAYIQYCVHHAGACSSKGGKLKMVAHNQVKLTNRLRIQLANINARVNSRMKPRSDKGPDTWSVGGAYGDCEDFAMTKRAMLMAAGWPSRALSLTVVRTSWGDGHAVLAVHTSDGTLVLDNLTRQVRDMRRIPYRVLSMQGDSPLHWTGSL